MRISWGAGPFAGYVTYEPEFRNSGHAELYEKIIQAVKRKSGYKSAWLHGNGDLALGSSCSDGTLSVSRWVTLDVSAADLKRLREASADLPDAPAYQDTNQEDY